MQLHKGIFWIVDLDNIDNNKDYCFKILCDSNGLPQENLAQQGIAKSGETYNHESFWSTLPKILTNNLSYNYYPRGRVEISNSKAIIYLNPNIATEGVKTFLINEFNLIKDNCIKSVRLFPDGTEHYKCYLDSD